MKKIIIYVVATFLVIGLFFAISLYLVFFHKVQRLEVINHSGNTLAQVELILGDQKYLIKDIKDQKTKKIDFKITKDCDATLLIYDQNNNLKKEKLLSGYLTQGYNAYFIVTIEENFESTVFCKKCGL